MVELRDIEYDEDPPENEDWVLISRAGEKFVASGSSAETHGATFYSPQPFDTLDEAVTASRDWAAHNDVGVIYVRGARSGQAGNEVVSG